MADAGLKPGATLRAPIVDGAGRVWHECGPRSFKLGAGADPN